ncbi:MAG: hypothetical protein JOY96_03220 [Verrucomicrobia bacterium]|nr:hypothetical protein [Verrucomicrobiota bacterium]
MDSFVVSAGYIRNEHTSWRGLHANFADRARPAIQKPQLDRLGLGDPAAQIEP